MAIDLLHNANFLIIQTIIIGLLNLLIPIIFDHHKSLRNIMMIIVSIIFFINIININIYYINGGKALLEVIDFSNIKLKFYIDGFGLLFITMIALLWPICLIYCFSYIKLHNFDNSAKFLFFLSLSVISSVLIGFSANLFTLFIFYELLTLSTIPLIAQQNTSHVRKSLKTYLLILVGSSTFIMLPAILIIIHIVGSDDFTPKGSFDSVNGGYAIYYQILFLFCAIGCAKAAIFPVHAWLPAAMVASYPVSGMLHAVTVVKAGLFFLAKIVVNIFGIDYLHNLFTPNWIIYLPIFTIIFASINALLQETVKKMLAYSTISQLSLAVASLFMFNTKGFAALSLHMVAHSFSKITLFFSSGNIYSATSKAKIEEMKSAATFIPGSFHLFLFASLSLIGFPPLAGFVSKYYMISSTIYDDNLDYGLLITIIISSIMTACYLFRVIFLAYQKQPTYLKLEIVKVPKGMTIATILCSFLIVCFLVFSKAILWFISL